MPIPFGSGVKSARAVYEELASREREPFLWEARRVSAYTIPHLVPPTPVDSRNQAPKLPTPWQSVGARGVNNLASKLLLALFPPNTSFFKLAVLEEALVQIQATPEVRSEVEESLIAMERRVQTELEIRTARPRLFEAFRHLIVAGNALFHVPEDGWRVFHLDQYVVRKDSITDRINLLIVKEQVYKAEVMDRLERPMRRGKASDSVDLYTAVWWDRDSETYRSVQEVEDQELIDSDEQWQPEQVPWIAVRLTTDEDHYGRGVGADALGDLMTADSLSEAVVEGAAIASRSVGMVKPGAGVSPSELNRTRNGKWISGDPDAVRMVRSDKVQDFGFVQAVLGDVIGRLSQVFLLNSAVQRQAERVTAEEIRFVAQELEDALGGVYSNLSQELQLPLARLLIANLTDAGALPRLPKGLVSPTVVTGLEALGRGQEFNRLRLFLQSLVEAIGPEAAQQYVNAREIASRYAVSLSLDTLGLVRSEEEVQAAQQQALRLQLAQDLGPQAIAAAGKNLPTTVAAAQQYQQAQS